MGKKNKISPIVLRFKTYFGTGILEDWQHLCRDVGLMDDLSSKTKCRKALRRVHVNIQELLDAIRAGTHPYHLNNACELSQYTVHTRKNLPKSYAKTGPVKALLRQIIC